MAKPPTFDLHDQAALRVLAAKPDRHKAWEALCAHLVQPRMEKSASLWLPFMEALLRGWPDEVRVWPDAFLNKANAPAATALVRHFYFGGRSPAAHTKALAHLAALSEATMPKLTCFTLAAYHLDTPARRVSNADRLSAEEAQMLVARMSMASMRSVRIEGTGLPTLLWEALAGAAWELDTLHVKGVARDAEVARLIEAPGVHFEALIAGDILGRVELGAASLAALVTHHAHALKALTLIEAMVDAPSFVALSQASWPRLTLLSLDRQRFALAPVLAAWLAHAPSLVALELSIATTSRRCWLNGTAVDTQPEDLSSLIEALKQSALPRLESLTLGFEFGARLSEVLRAFFDHAGFAESLKQLRLPSRGADAKVAAMLLPLHLEALSVVGAEPSFWPAMTTADFTRLRRLAAGASGRDLQDEELAFPFVLMKDKAPPLEALHLDHATVSHAVLDAIESAPYFAKLRALSNTYSPSFTDASARARFEAMSEVVTQRLVAEHH